MYGCGSATLTWKRIRSNPEQSGCLPHRLARARVSHLPDLYWQARRVGDAFGVARRQVAPAAAQQQVATRAVPNPEHSCDRPNGTSTTTTPTASLPPLRCWRCTPFWRLGRVLAAEKNRDEILQEHANEPLMCADRRGGRRRRDELSMNHPDARLHDSTRWQRKADCYVAPSGLTRYAIAGLCPGLVH